MLKTIIIPFLFISCFSSFAQLNSGLVGKYYFNNSDATDDLGNINGTISQAHLADDRFGCHNNAFQFFQDSNSFITLGDNYDQYLSGSDNTVSFSFWFNTLQQDDTDNPMVVKWASSCGLEQNRQMGIELNAESKMSMIFTSSLTSNIALSMNGHTVINDSNWHHAVVMYDGANDNNFGQDRVSIYIDNVAQIMSVDYSAGTPTDMPNGSAHLAIGAPVTSTGTYCDFTNPYVGLFDDMRIYDRPLTLAEVDSLYNESNPCLNTESLVEQELMNCTIYPNPANSLVHIKADDIVKKLQIISIDGRVIPVIFENNTIQMQNLTAGHYTIQIEFESGIVVNRTLLKN